MADDNLRLVNFLKKLHIFRGLDDEQLKSVAEKLEEKTYPADTIKIKQGELGDRFYVLYKGSVDVKRGPANNEQHLAILVSGDYFGEEALLNHARRTATVRALEEITLLELTQADFFALLKKIPKLRANFEVAVTSHRLSRKLRFKWIQEGEVIYFLARKHPILLWESLAGPIFALIIPLALFIFSLQIASAAVTTSGAATASTAKAISPTFLMILAVICFIADLLWGVWKVLDWGNDYYIVTNKRVIWLEKVIGLYDSRQEAPLTTILSIGVETDQFGRILDYGDVVVRTFIGRILFHHVSRPYQAASLVEEHWTRTREVARRADTAVMKQAIQERLGLVPPTPTVAAPKSANVPTIYKPSVLRVMLRNFFKVRIEESGTITYRKHFFVLFKQTWKPGFTGLLFLGALIFRLFNLPGTVAGFWTDTLVIALLFTLLGAVLWWLYEYVDWSNDIFTVTDDQIMDIDRTPFGREEKKAAPLDNILSTEYRREGFLQVLLNYGTVYITVGGAQLAFEDVTDPPAVQQDIDQRRVARVQRKREADTKADNERLADWFATYHKNSEEFRREQDTKSKRGGGV